MTIATAVYTSQNNREYRAMPRAAFVHPENLMPAQADYVVVNPADQVTGFIVHETEVRGAVPYEAYTARSKYISDTESLHGAVSLVARAWEGNL